MATDAEVINAGFRLPSPESYVSFGDDSIRQNAHAAYDLQYIQGVLPAGIDLNQVGGKQGPGAAVYVSSGDALNRPIEDANGFILEVFSHGSNARIQRYTSFIANSQSVWTRRGNIASNPPVWFEWSRVDSGGIDLGNAGESSGPGRREVLQQKLRARKGGTIGTDGKAVVSLRFDDAAGDFATKILPLLEARQLPFSRITTTDRVGNEAGGENDSWSNIQSYCIRAGGEVWNHGKTHGNADNPAAVDAEITGALETLRQRLPKLVIDCWSPPGGQTSGWTGYMPVETIEQLTATYAGQQIMAHHAIGSGYFMDTWFPPLDGVLRDGEIYNSCDARDDTYTKGLVDKAVNMTAGVVLMWHSNNIGSGSNMTIAQFTAVLDYLVAKRDAGDIEVLTVSGMAVADSATDYRADPLTTHGGSNWSTTIPYVTMRPDILGSTRELTATVTGTAGATVTSRVGTSERTWTIPTGGTLKVRHPSTIPTDTASLPVSITGGTTANAHLYAV